MPVISQKVLKARGLVKDSISSINKVLYEMDEHESALINNVDIYIILCGARNKLVEMSTDLFTQECLELRSVGRKPFGKNA